MLTQKRYLLEKRTVSDMKFGDEYDEVIDYILLQHWGQIRKFDKTPYMYHPTRVAKFVQDYTNNKVLTTAAFLHDVIEDRIHTLTHSKNSKSGKYISMNLDMLVHNEDDRNFIYEALKKHQDIKMVL